MARHRTGLKRWLDLKPKAHAGFSLLTRGSPLMARLLDFFPDYAPPRGARVLHDDEIVSPMAAPRYAAERARLAEHCRDTVRVRADVPPFPRLRRLVWEVPEIYMPGRIIAPVDLAQGAIVSLQQQGPTVWAVTRPRPIRRAPHRIEGRAVLIPYMKHYGHLMHDRLAPIAFAAWLGLISREAPVTVVHARDDNPVAARFAEGMLRLGLAHRVLPIGHDEGAHCEAYLECDAVVANGEHGYAFPEATALLRDILLAGGEAAPDSPHRRVFLTRGQAKLRRMEGEAALTELLRAQGFHVFESRWDNLAEQLAVFAGAETVVGVHGAGLVNVLFCRPGARLIEIMAENARKTTGLHWAAMAGMDYASILGGPEGPRQSFAIEPEAVAREIAARLA